MTFQSQYPRGLDFALDLKSSAGKVTEAGVNFQFAPGYVNRVAAHFDPSGKLTVHFPGGGIPQWVGVEYWWTLKDEAGNHFETPHKQDEYVLGRDDPAVYPHRHQPGIALPGLPGRAARGRSPVSGANRRQRTGSRLVHRRRRDLLRDFGHADLRLFDDSKR